MAKGNISAWTPILKDRNIVTQAIQRSAIMDAATSYSGGARYVVGTNEVPRLLSSKVNSGCDLVTNDSTGDTVTMYTNIFNGKEELCDDAALSGAPGAASTYRAFDNAWLSQFHVAFDNASIGVSGARSGTLADKRPYTSILKSVRTTDGVYTADDNYVSGALTYDSASAMLGKLEASRFVNDTAVVILANPRLKAAFRAIKDDNDRPIFMEGANVVDDTLFGRKVYWTHGAVVSTNYDMTSVTNPLLVAVDATHLVWGEGQAQVDAPVGPVSQIITAKYNPTFLGSTLVYAAKEGFVLTLPQAASVLEVSA